MSLMDMIAQAGGSAALGQLGARVGLTPEQTQAAMAALAPAVSGGLARQVRESGVGGALANAPADVEAPEATTHGNEILGQIFGSRDVSRSVAAEASSRTGIDVNQLKALLPLLATVAAGAMSAKATGAAAQGLGQAGGLDGLLGMLDRDGDGSPLNDIIGMGGKLFGR